MALLPRTRLGPYEVIDQIGVGGMGEVYRAADTNLGRQVAIKVLPDAVASDGERLARFDREARTLAALNHPNIAAIYGVEKSGTTTALVMELVEGPTLADRIVAGRGPGAFTEVFRIARQVAAALEAAHEQAIVHRDLKPANIKLRSDGMVKVLDFGLAKAVEPAANMTSGLSMSPTITTPTMTQAGVILGTAAYMSPEQAKGRSADKRSDIWAFGCVFYEMLTGRRAFEGDGVSDTMAAVLRSEPDWSTLPVGVPPAVESLLRRCLEKDARQRLADISTARFVLDERALLAVGSGPQAAPSTTKESRRMPIAAVAVAVAALTSAMWWSVTRQTPPVEMRLEITTPPGRDGRAPDHSRPQSADSVIQYRSGGVMARVARTAAIALAVAMASLTVRIEAQKWVVPRTADGRPDLEGVWENNSATPLERPRQLADKPRLSDEELESLKRRAATLFGPEAEATFGDALYQTLLANTTPRGLGSTGSYSQNWLPDRYFEHRTSLIEDPADGRLPTPTPAGARIRTASAGRFGLVGASAQDMSLQDRCIHYGFPDLFAAYMAVYRIVQSPQFVAIQYEKIHDSRIIPLDGRPHLSSAVRNFMGDSRGKWDGDTLVVETTNFHPKGNPMGGYNVLSDENLRLVERFRRTADDTIEYTFTVDNPTMWTKPWTAVINWKRSRGELLEYACHEGNYSLRGMLSAARAEEAR